MNIILCGISDEEAARCKSVISPWVEEKRVRIHLQQVSGGRELLFFWDTKYADTDAIYMSCDMEGGTGVQTAARLREKGYTGDIVFCSVDESHAVEAFDVEAYQYILIGKTPIERRREIFASVVSRYEMRQKESLHCISRSGSRSIPLKNILYMEVSNRIVTVYFWEEGKEKSFSYYDTLTRLERELGAQGFRRIHQSYLVSEKAILSENAETVKLLNGHILPVGRRYRSKG